MTRPVVPCLGVVVVVEDDEDTRELLKTVLLRRGYRVATAADGLDGLDLLRATDAVCFVLVDLFMPRMDGFGLLREMVNDPKLAALPVCLSTSAPDAAPLGVACLPKPIDLSRLFAMIDLHCVANSIAQSP
ncbi:MAG: response regulator [Pseudomonadota bacterium]